MRLVTQLRLIVLTPNRVYPLYITFFKSPSLPQLLVQTYTYVDQLTTSYFHPLTLLPNNKVPSLLQNYPTKCPSAWPHIRHSKCGFGHWRQRGHGGEFAGFGVCHGSEWTVCLLSTGLTDSTIQKAQAVIQRCTLVLPAIGPPRPKPLL